MLQLVYQVMKGVFYMIIFETRKFKYLELDSLEYCFSGNIKYFEISE